MNHVMQPIQLSSLPEDVGDYLNPPDRTFASRAEYGMTIRSDLWLEKKGERRPAFQHILLPYLLNHPITRAIHGLATLRV
jgi:hypothetical protein